MVSLTQELLYSFDELNKKLIADPYPFYDELLCHDGPIYAIDEKNPDQKTLLLTRYDDVLKVLSLAKEISNDKNYLTPEKPRNYGDSFILNTDGVEHATLRKIFVSFFCKSRLENVRIFLNKYLPSLIQSLEIHDEIDLNKHVAESIPLAVMGHLMGIDNMADLRNLRVWTLELMSLADEFTNQSDFAIQAEKNQAAKSMSDFCKSLILQKSNNTSDDLVSFIVDECSKQKIDEKKILENVIFMMIASHDTSVNMIANGLFLLLSHPKELHKLALNPELADDATEEILRFESPLQRATYRVTKSEINLDYFKIPSDTKVMLFLGAANRDPRHFESPDEFIISKKKTPNLTFGHGIHNCIGKALARLEGALAFPALTPYLINVKLKSAKPTWRNNTLFRIPETLIVTKR
ncbi:cytochrome P450 [Candidatus Methylopumilus turicensis]|uniref:Putative Cytochrome P450 107B1 n=1 Tax=Candidatus Methylopumilus turicensis TaxID=1581680 RepID=A0A0B7J0C2_9PROT|nr:cytochrome P450 [Candidatus Methylopumilus turicensis]CEN56197.1 putative Cytochrome P450 107B1 [Candidatus Methylopumilus turicensis]